MSERRNVQLKRRLIGTRSVGTVEVFNIEKIEAHFKQSIDLINMQLEKIDSKSMPAIAEEMMRSQVVFIDSAFDYFIHEIIKLGIVNMYNHDWPVSEKYNNLRLTMKEVEYARDDDDDWLKEWIDDRYTTETFMSSKAYNAACNLLDISIADSDEHIIKDEIDELFKRRNLIAHQADRNSADAKRNPISIEEVRRYLDNIKFITNELIDKIKSKCNQ